MHKQMKIAIILIIAPIIVATTVSIAFAALDVFESVDMGSTSQGSIEVGALKKRELVLSHLFFWVGEPSCRGTITLQHIGTGETIVKSYSFGSSSQYMELKKQSIVVTLKRGTWTVNHQRDSNEAELEINSTFSGSQEFDNVGLILWWVLVLVGVVAGFVLITDLKEKERYKSHRRVTGRPIHYSKCPTCGRLVVVGNACAFCSYEVYFERNLP